MLRVRFGAVLLLAMTGCTEPTGWDEGRLTGGQLSLQASEAEYPLPHEGAMVSFTVANTAGQDRFIGNCGGAPVAAVERQQGGSWSEYSAGLCLAVYDMAPLPLTPGESVDGMVQIMESGRFRLKVFAKTSPTGEWRWEVTSAPFTVVAERVHQENVRLNGDRLWR